METYCGAALDGDLEKVGTFALTSFEAERRAAASELKDAFKIVKSSN
jgi:hypothetical protein